ncbi:MAG: hypothetical protein INR71_06290, partial [Terriglobus roseus]|nr:hypothetical protein [Terriglobus roseus]
MYWDQGSLLKQLDVIGARGRNWPLRDGKDQARLIAKGAPAVIEQPAGPVHRPTSSGASRNGRSHASSTTSAASDHRSAQSLFEPPEEEEERAFTPTNGTFVAPRPSAKPPSRDLSDILAGDGDIASSDPAAQNLSPLKSGAGKHYQPMRLFDENEDADPAPLVKDIKTDPKKFKHFEFGDGEDAPTEDADAKAAAEARRKKHNSQWNFADFSTPDKVNTKLHTQNLRNFSWSDDEGDGDTSPIKRPVVHHERPDAKPHFEFRDEDTPIADRKLPILTKGRAHNDGLGLYKNHIFGEEANAEDEKAAKKPLATVTNVSNRDRRRDFDAHFDVGGASPAAKARVAEGGDKENENGATAGADAPAPAAPKLHEGQKKVLSTLQASWDMYDQPADAS